MTQKDEKLCSQDALHTDAESWYRLETGQDVKLA